MSRQRDTQTWHRIRQQYYQEPKELIYWMRFGLDMPLDSIASALGIAFETLQHWCKMWGISTARMKHNSMPTVGKVLRRARELGYPDIATAIGSMRANRMSVKAVCQALQCGQTTYLRHLPPEFKRLFAVMDPIGRTGGNPFSPASSHPWRGQFPQSKSE